MTWATRYRSASREGIWIIVLAPVIGILAVTLIPWEPVGRNVESEEKPESR